MGVGTFPLEIFFKKIELEEIDPSPIHFPWMVLLLNGSFGFLLRNLSSTYSENGSTTCWACALNCRFTIFHGVWFSAFDVTFISALNTISYCHNCTRLEVLLARPC